MELSCNIIIVLKPTLLKPVPYSGSITPDYQGYKSWIALVRSRTRMAAAVQAKKISDMIISMESERPKFIPVLPKWDLGIVLEALVSLLINLISERQISVWCS